MGKERTNWFLVIVRSNVTYFIWADIVWRSCSAPLFIQPMWPDDLGHRMRRGSVTSCCFFVNKIRIFQFLVHKYGHRIGITNASWKQTGIFSILCKSSVYVEIKYYAIILKTDHRTTVYVVISNTYLLHDNKSENMVQNIVNCILSVPNIRMGKWIYFQWKHYLQITW